MFSQEKSSFFFRSENNASLNIMKPNHLNCYWTLSPVLYRARLQQRSSISPYLGFAFSTVTVVPAGLSWIRLSSSSTIKDLSSIGSKSACSSASSFNDCTMSTPHLPSTAWSSAPFAHFRTMHHKRCRLRSYTVAFWLPIRNDTAASSQFDCLVQSTWQMI